MPTSLTRLQSWVVVLSACFTCVGTGAVALYRLNSVERQLSDIVKLSERVQNLERQGEFREKRLGSLEDDTKSMTRDLGEMKGDIKLILRVLEIEKKNAQ